MICHLEGQEENVSAATQSIFIPLVGLCLFFGVLCGSVYASSCLMRLSATGGSSRLATQAAIGFAPPLILLFAWEGILSEAISFNTVSAAWLVLLSASVVLLAARSSAVAKGYAAGLLLGCCAFCVCAVCFAILD
jgi:hypothetical protein